MGIGVSSGENRAVEAAKKAISSPLLETSIVGAQGVLMNITGGENLSLFEAQEAADIVQDAADEDVNMIFGTVINPELEDELVITVIATGFNEKSVSRSPERPVQQERRQTQSFEEKEREDSFIDLDDRSHSDQSFDSSDRKSSLDNEPDVPSFIRGRRSRRR